MKNFKRLNRILISTDFSELSKIAILRALDLAKANQATVTILHIAKKGILEKWVNWVSPDFAKALITPEEYAKSLLEKQVKELIKSKIKVNYQIISGNSSAPKILNYAKKHKMDLIILGAHGKYSIHDWFVGTTAEYIARKTTLPVLIIKKPQVKPYRKILIPIDCSAASEQALLFANQLFPRANLRLLHVGDHEFEDLLKNNAPHNPKIKTLRNSILLSIKEKIKTFLKKTNPNLIKLACDIKFGYPGAVIIDEAKKQNQDLVVMGTKGHGKRHYLFIGRVASRVLIETDRDVLLVPPTGNR